MAASLLHTGGIALVGAPDGDIIPKDAKSTPVQAMQVDITQDIIDELLESARGGKLPQIIFGRTPQLKYGDKTHMLQSSTELHRYELYRSSRNSSYGDDDDDDDSHFEFAGLINHSLTVHKAEDVTAGVDSALEQLRNNMAAISEFKEANKTIVADATPGRASSHRRYPSASFKPSHLAPSKIGSPLLSAPSSPMHKRPPTSQPTNSHDVVVNALRVPVIHLLAREPATEASLAATCRTSLANIRDVLPKVAKRSTTDTDKWQLTDKSFRELNPYKFPYQSQEDRQQAIDSAIKSFDRQRLAKDDKLWQILLPQDQRGQGICLSRSTVKAPEAKPKASTPMHKISDLTKKKPVAKKAADKTTEKKPRETKPKAPKEIEIKPKSSIKEKYLARQKLAVKDVKEVKVPKEVKEEQTNASTPATSTPRAVAPPLHNTPTDASKNRPKKPSTTEGNAASARTKPKMSGRDALRDRPVQRPFKPTMPVNTKPKNPSPLSASPPINASDLDQSHPAHEALAASPAKSSVNSDRSLKRKANDLDSDIHNHNVVAKKPQMDRATPKQTPSHSNSKVNASTPSSTSSMKRKSDDSSSSNTPSTAPKVRKVANIDTGLASRYHHNNPRASPGASSSSTTSPSMPSLSFRQTVELSQKFQKYYKKYEELYWELTESDKPPTEAQRNNLLKMHKHLEEMKREIKAGAGMHHR
ncbi:hypothetical protein yc1106_06389 [Curvularia clavata]|uniref:Uncharacterized protein n=1 Tax=Curvularia clavata TaxID=95742 RepID=A0A9Q8ZCC3_CURCL|nr:hypothetical protein yc1106_06389 [Curvularia clavata]